MTKPEMIQMLKTDVQAWNRWKRANSFTWHDLSGVQLSNAFLTHANFNDTTLSGANLDGANLSGADFYGTFLDGATLKEADLSRARLTWASLEGADLAGAMLEETIIEWGDLNDVNLAGARLVDTIFVGVDLGQVKGLDTALHLGPSVLDVVTLSRSNGKIPESFLRSTGFSEEFIRYIPSLIGAQEGGHFHSCFISYSHRDEEFAERLFSKMREAKLRVWYAPEEMKGGQKLHEQIETAIRIYDKLLVVLSDASLASEWVKTEIRNARRAEKATGKRKLFPVRLVDMETIQAWGEFDADTGKDLGVELREYFIPDFREWKEHDKFEDSFKRLLRDLKAEATPAH